MTSVKRQSASIVTATLPSALVLSLDAESIVRSTTGSPDESDWWIRYSLMEVSCQEWEEYLDGANSIIASHGVHKCVGMTMDLPCSVCNIKHGDAEFGRRTARLRDFVTADPMGVSHVEVDTGFDPSEIDTRVLRDIAEAVLRPGNPNDAFEAAHFKQYGLPGEDQNFERLGGMRCLHLHTQYSIRWNGFVCMDCQEILRET